MAVKVPFPRVLFMHRLVRSIGIIQRHPTNTDKANRCRREMRTGSSASQKCDENGGNETPLSRRRRPLSPLERISGLLPPEALSPEVMQLQGDPNNHPAAVHRAPEDSGHVVVPKEGESENGLASDGGKDPDTFDTQLDGEGTVASSTLPGKCLLAFGELLIAEYRKKGVVEFRKMFQLQTGMSLQSSWGAIRHSDIVGQPAGQSLKTSQGVPILVRRASLEDYVLYMRRGAAITLPKDACAMLMMMDVTEGDRVLESGSGSGSMSLFLSRAVGSKGGVVSVEVREDHHSRAVRNYQRWRASWEVRRGEEWPDNVQFHNTDLRTAPSFLAGQEFHAVALDMLSPHLVLPAVLPHLQPGAVCAVYLVNITQIVELLESVRCLALPLLCEHVIEVPVRDWLVTPALLSDGRYVIRKQLREDGASGDTDKEETSFGNQPAFGSIPYITRPNHEQRSHSAFLVKLRKCMP
ncbi:tRNA (adenine(58)-N(1))-methyltransferase, mitochondrial [Brachionichthys hirsutus]|uniref:tRNA (adenine(58)-N(1))-methyltransferase, mitochondrial n=1 Tax=Brachionichthys hirsutus TaxID=412623 RepID=UPI003604EA39